MEWKKIFTWMVWKHILIPGLVEQASLPRKAKFTAGRLSECVWMSEVWKYHPKKGKKTV